MDVAATLHTIPPPADGAAQLSELAARIRVHHGAVEGAVRTGFQNARLAGDLLTQAKALVPHGGWAGWLKENFPGKARTARLYMQVARAPELAEANWQRVANVDSPSLRVAAQMIAQPRTPAPEADRIEAPAADTAAPGGAAYTDHEIAVLRLLAEKGAPVSTVRINPAVLRILTTRGCIKVMSGFAAITPHGNRALQAIDAGDPPSAPPTAREITPSADPAPPPARSARNGASSAAPAPEAPAPRRRPAAEPEDEDEDDDEPEGFDHDDVVRELEETHREVERLSALVEKLSADDKGAEIVRLTKQYGQLESRLQQAVNSGSAAGQQARASATVLSRVRELLGVQVNKEIVPAIRKLQKGGAE